MKNCIHNYLCILDVSYSIRWLTMYNSLMKHGDESFFYVVAIDNDVIDIIHNLKLENVICVSINEIEKYENIMCEIKKVCTKAQYCWASVPVAMEYAFDVFHSAEITYIDSDLYFFSSPKIIFEEFYSSEADVLLTKHNFAPQYSFFSDIAGEFCVQFMPVKNTEEGRRFLDWWKNQCTESYLNPEVGVFNDQKSLSKSVSMFKSIYILQNQCAGVAPWNVQIFKVGVGPTVNDNDVVFFHFHNLIWFGNKSYGIHMGFYEMNDNVFEYIYSLYIAELIKSKKKIIDVSRSMTDMDWVDITFRHGCIVFGCGKHGKAIVKNLGEIGVADRLLAICDNDVTKQGTTLSGIKVVNVEDCVKENPDATYIVSGKYENEMRVQLNNLGINKILSLRPMSIYSI